MAAKIVPTSGRGATSAADAVDDELNGIMDAVAEDLDNWDGGNDLYDEPPPPPPKKLAPPKPVEPPPPPPPPPEEEEDDEDDEMEAELLGLSNEAESALDAMKRGLERTKKKLDKSRAREAALKAEVDGNKKALEIMRRDRAEAAAAAERLRKANAAAQEQNAQQRRRANLRRRMVQHEDAFDASSADLLLAEDAVAVVPGGRAGASALRRLCGSLRKLSPLWWLHQDVENVEARFGTSVSVYFVYSELLCTLALGNAILWIGVQTISVLQQAHPDGGAPDVPSRQLGIPMIYLPPRQLYFSAYGPGNQDVIGGWSHLSTVYALTVVAYMLWYLLLTLRRMVTARHKRMYSEVFGRDDKTAYARQVLTSWDVSVADEASLHDHKYEVMVALRMLRSETQWRATVQARSAQEATRLFTRRIFVMGTHACLQAAVWTAIVYVQIYSTAIDRQAYALIGSTLASSLASVVLYSLLIEIMPLLCPILASGCKWDNPRSERTHMLWGFFFGRVIGLLVLGLSEIGMLLRWEEATAMTLAAFDASSSSSAVTGSNVTSAGGNGLVVTRTGIAYFLDTIAREPAMQNYECGQDQLANRLLQQALIGFVSPKLINLLTAFGKYLLTKLRGKPWTKDKFKVELKFIRNVYYQGLLWIAVPYFPLMAFLMPILLILEFKFDYAFLKRLCNKTTSPFQGDLPAFLYFHIVTLLVFVGLWVYLFLFESAPIDRCGPFWNSTTNESVTVATHISATFDDWGSGYYNSLETYVLTNSYLLWIALILLLFVALDSGHSKVVFEEHAEETRNTMSADKLELQSKLGHLEKQVVKLRKLQQQAVQEEAPIGAPVG